MNSSKDGSPTPGSSDGGAMAIAIVSTSPLGGTVAVGVRTGADVAATGADVATAGADVAVAGAGVAV